MGGETINRKAPAINRGFSGGAQTTKQKGDQKHQKESKDATTLYIGFWVVSMVIC